MNRIDFLKRLSIGLGAAVVAPRALGGILNDVKNESSFKASSEHPNGLSYYKDGKCYLASRYNDGYIICMDDGIWFSPDGKKLTIRYPSTYDLDKGGIQLREVGDRNLETWISNEKKP